MRYTAAHSTAVVDDTNSTEITDHGALEYRAGNVLVDRAENDGAQWLDMSHDGYRSLYGIIHRRRLWLSPDGGDLRGEDTFGGPDGRPVTVPDRRFIVRFHLHPTVKATLAQSGQAVLMRLPSGRGWRLRASGAGIGLAESIYLGEEGRVRRTEQIVLVGQVPDRRQHREVGADPDGRVGLEPFHSLALMIPRTRERSRSLKLMREPAGSPSHCCMEDAPLRAAESAA